MEKKYTQEQETVILRHLLPMISSDEIYNTYEERIVDSCRDWIKYRIQCNENIENRIEQELMALNCSPNTAGFVYWKEALMYMYNNNIKLINMMDIYEELAKKHNKKVDYMSAKFAYSNKTMVESVKRKYNVDGKITPGKTLQLIRMHLFN